MDREPEPGPFVARRWRIRDRKWSLEMPPLEETDRLQYAVLWEFAGNDDYGQPSVVTQGIELEVRWKFKRGSSVDAKGLPVAYDAVVIVDREIAVGSNMWLGRLADWDDALKDEVMYVIEYNSTPDLRNINERRSVKLSWYRADLPG
jgi:hypothetical protein